jgi:hypothetical protein
VQAPPAPPLKAQLPEMPRNCGGSVATNCTPCAVPGPSFVNSAWTSRMSPGPVQPMGSVRLKAN